MKLAIGAAAIAALAGTVPVVLAAEDPTPRPRSESWRVVSFVEPAGLATSSVFALDFEPDGTVWAAASSGLYRFDGFVWERHGLAQGLPSDHVRSVCVLRDGTLWVGTDRGAGIYGADGFDPAGSAGELPGPSVRRIVEGPDGALWFCCDRWPDATVDAGLARLANGEWTTWGVEDGLPDDYVSDVFVDQLGEHFVLTRSGLARLAGDTFTPVAPHLSAANGYAWDMAETADGGLIVSVDGGFLLRKDGTWRFIAGMPQAKLAGTRDGDVLLCRADTQAAFMRWNHDRFEPATDPFPYSGNDVQIVREAPDGAVWAAGDALLVRWERRGGSWDTYAGLPAPSFSDGDGGVWFTDRERVMRWSQDGWTHFQDCGQPISLDPDGTAWMRAGADLMSWKRGVSRRYEAREIGLDSYLEIHPQGPAGVWVCGTDRGRPVLTRFDGESWTRIPLDVAEPDETVARMLVATDSDVWVLLNRAGPLRQRLLRFGPDGPQPIELPARASGDSALRMHLHADELWVFGFSGLHVLAPGSAEWQRVAHLPGGGVFSVVERHGETWVTTTASTGGKHGLSRLADGNWTHYPYGVWHLAGRSSDSSAFYSARDGLLTLRSWDETPSILSLPTPDRVEQAVADSDGGIWMSIGTHVLHYRPDATPPETIVVDGPRHAYPGENVVLRVRGVERFVTTPAPYRVESSLGGGPWEDRGLLRGDRVILPASDIGRHTVAVRLIDADQNADPTPAVWEFDVRPVPMQARTWFVPAIAATLLIIAALAVCSLVAWKRLGVQARRLEVSVRERTAALHASEREYRALFEQSHDAILVLDPHGNICDVNREALKLFRARPGELRGRSVKKVLPGLQMEESGRGETAIRVDRIDGNLEVLAAASERRDETGALVGSQVILRDVTEKTLVEERLRQAEKMQALGLMAGAIAHDFNNVLMGIMGYGELLREALDEDPQSAEKVNVILESAERAQNLTRQIQTIGNSGPKENETCDVHAVLARLESLLRPIVGPDVTLVVNPRSRRTHARIEAAKLERVLVNLAVNARDAMQAVGTLTVETRHANDSTGSPAVVVVVRDTGEGMDEATRQRIFEPFFTTKTDSGSGLGLAIVYALIDQCGGSVVVDSARGRGSTFLLTLPAGASTPATSAPPDAPGPSVGCETVLVVEDEPSIRELMCSHLERRGYRVTAAEGARQALDHVRKRSFDLLLTDVLMPGMRGDELARRVNAICPAMRVLFVSGHFEPDSLGSPLNGPLLRKPFALSALDRAVRGVLDEGAVAMASD